MLVQEYDAMRREIEKVVKKHGLRIAYSTAVLTDMFSATIILEKNNDYKKSEAGE